MFVQLIEVPYDSGHWGARMGRGPGALLAGGAAERLRAEGHAVETERVTRAAAFPTEVATGFEVCRRLAEQVRAAAWHSRLPLVLSGNCLASLGALAGMGGEEVGIVWLDAHADYHTPETTPSGFLDGMALAVATGRCWREMAGSLPGFRAVRPEHALLVGARDLDAAEPGLLQEAGVRWVPPGGVPDGVLVALDALRERVGRVYLHLDLDVLEPAEGRANGYASPGGLPRAALLEVVRAVGDRFAIGAASLSAYDPAVDTDSRAREVALLLLEAVARAAS